ncbi:MAG: RNA polymerase sigma factor [Crocinitomicaceae bacterium]|nr:RNA polymerase sigma factor [Crocinitomicaceae bacterium]
MLDAKTKILIDNLVERLKNREESAMSELYDRYADTLYGLASKIVKSDEIAQDIVQDSFVKVWKNVTSYDQSKGSFFTWMLNITRNTAIDFLRKQKKYKATSIQDVENSVHMEGGIQANMDAIGLKEMVNDLNSDQKILVEYIYFKGYTQQEVADELEIPLGTVKTRIRSAVKALQKWFVLIWIFWI